MIKKVIFSAKQNQEIIAKVIELLKNTIEFEFTFHDPTKQYFNLSRMPKSFKEADCFIVKVRNECSLDTLHFAKLNNIPALHDVYTVLNCKNKVALDYSLRYIFNKYQNSLEFFSLPSSWIQNSKSEKRFKTWAKSKLPLVLKSHYQHDKYNRFNFLMRTIDELQIFYNRYKELTYYDIYVQKFIECDGIDRKIYVIGDKIFGVKRENPIYIYMKNDSSDIDTDTLKRSQIEITKEIRKLSEILSSELNLKIFGYDLIKSLYDDKYYLVDLNDFPGFKGIEKVEEVLANYILDFIRNS
jgi:glutathione synthase/RimK-type ligase-like ATP-grasp enzyme